MSLAAKQNRVYALDRGRAFDIVRFLENVNQPIQAIFRNRVIKKKSRFYSLPCFITAIIPYHPCRA